MNKIEKSHISLIEEFKKTFLGFRDEIKTDSYKDHTPGSNILEEISRNNQCSYMVFDAVNLQPLFITSNVEKMTGYSADTLKYGGASFFLDILHEDHHQFLFDFLKIIKYQIRAHKFVEGVPNYCKHSICGLNVFNKSGEIKKRLLDFVLTGLGKSGLGSIWIIASHDVTHLMKGDFYWLRSAFGREGEHKVHYHSSVGQMKKRDILTKREKSILKLISDGHSTIEIAEKLFISPNTVEKHRKNMIARTGAKNSTALIQLCHIIGDV